MSRFEDPDGGGGGGEGGGGGMVDDAVDGAVNSGRHLFSSFQFFSFLYNKYEMD